MNTLTKTLLTTSLCLFAATPVFAGNGHGHGGIHQRMERQERRIEQGVRSGELTRLEARKLIRNQREIRHLARDFRDDGRLSRRERAILQDRLDVASAKIRAFKHNDRARPTHHHRHDRWDADWSRFSYVDR